MGGINCGWLEQDCVEEKTKTKNCKETELSGSDEPGTKSSIIIATALSPVPLLASYANVQVVESRIAPGNLLQIPPHSLLPTAQRHLTVSPSGSLIAIGRVWLQPCCNLITGEVIARGLEFIRPVSFRLAKENVLIRLYEPPNGAIQAEPAKRIVIVEDEALEKAYESLFSPKDQFSVSLKSVQIYLIGVSIPEHPARQTIFPSPESRVSSSIEVEPPAKESLLQDIW